MFYDKADDLQMQSETMFQNVVSQCTLIFTNDNRVTRNANELRNCDNSKLSGDMFCDNSNELRNCGYMAEHDGKRPELISLIITPTINMMFA
jgi:hypothetical protein